MMAGRGVEREQAQAMMTSVIAIPNGLAALCVVMGYKVDVARVHDVTGVTLSL
jgi:hypothetical protein